MNNQKETYEFKYQGDIDAIDIDTLIQSQIQYSCILRGIKSHFYPEVELKIKVQSFEKNSFDLNQIIEVFIVSGTLIFEKIDYIAQIFKYLKLYLDIKKLLGPKKPEKIEITGDNNIIIYGDNNNITVPEDIWKVYISNYTINKSLIKNGQILSDDPEIMGIEIIDTKKNESIINIPRRDFSVLSSTNPYMNKDLNEDIRESAILYIKKLDLDPKKRTKWSFVYEGKILPSVSITDENFLRRVKEGEKFGNGDRLNCTLKTTQKLDPDTGVFIDSKYEITYVKQIIRKNEQFTTGL